MTNKKIRSALLELGLIGLGVFTVLPFFWMLFSSFKTNSEILSTVQTFFPQSFTWDNYKVVLPKFNFIRYFANSMYYAVALTVITIYTSAISGFVLSKYEFRGRGFLFSAILLTMMVPSVVTIIPRYSIMQALVWIDSVKALIIPSLFTSFGIFLMRQSCVSIPDDMLAAARIDGVGEWYMFHHIILPQLQNGIVSLAIFQFLWAWDDYLWPYIILHSDSKQLLSIGLKLFSGRYSTDYAGLFAATTITIVPVIVMYLIFQKRFIEGVSSASIKG